METENTILVFANFEKCDDKVAKERACFFEHYVDEDLSEKMKAFANKIKESKIKIGA